MNRLTKGRALVSGLSIGSSTNVQGIAYGTGAIDFASINDGATGTGTITVTGAAVGDMVVVNPPALTTGLAFAGAAVTGADTVTVYVVNASGGAINEGEVTFKYVWFDLT